MSHLSYIHVQFIAEIHFTLEFVSLLSSTVFIIKIARLENLTISSSKPSFVFAQELFRCASLEI